MATSYNLRDSRILRDFSVWVKGVGKIGMCPTLTLPDISIQTAEFRGGGMDGTLDIPMGLAKMEMSFALFTWDEDVWTNLGYGVGAMDVQFQFLGTTMTPAGTEDQVSIEVTGLIRDIKTDPIVPGQKVNMTTTVACRTYRHTIASRVVTDIDVFNKVFLIDGTDKSATARQNLGFTY